MAEAEAARPPPSRRRGRSWWFCFLSSALVVALSTIGVLFFRTYPFAEPEMVRPMGYCLVALLAFVVFTASNRDQLGDIAHTLRILCVVAFYWTKHSCVANRQKYDPLVATTAAEEPPKSVVDVVANAV